MRRSDTVSHDALQGLSIGGPRIAIVCGDQDVAQMNIALALRHFPLRGRKCTRRFSRRERAEKLRWSNGVVFLTRLGLEVSESRPGANICFRPGENSGGVMEAASTAPPRPPTRRALNRRLAFLALGIAATTLLGLHFVETHDLIWRAQRCAWGAYLTMLQFSSMALVFVPNLPIPFALPSHFARGRRDLQSTSMFSQFGKLIVAGSHFKSVQTYSDDEWVGKSRIITIARPGSWKVTLCNRRQESPSR